MYTMVSNALTDMTNLGDLLAEQPDLADAPGAQPLVLSQAQRQQQQQQQQGASSSGASVRQVRSVAGFSRARR
jgi:ABC-type transport system involved in Fe-S cluster assembly fused permease/ATPase subunit